MASGACQSPVRSVKSIQLFAGSYDSMFGIPLCPFAETRNKVTAAVINATTKTGLLAMSLTVSSPSRGLSRATTHLVKPAVMPANWLEQHGTCAPENVGDA